MKASVARNIKAFLHKRLRFQGLRHIPLRILGIGGKPSAFPVAHVALSQNRDDFGGHMFKCVGDVVCGFINIWCV